MLGDVEVFWPALSQYNLNRFVLSTDLINCVGYLLEVFAIRYMMKYFLLLHIFQTTSGNAR